MTSHLSGGFGAQVKFLRGAHINTCICTTAHDSLRHVNMWAALVLLFCLTSSGSSLPLKVENGTVTVRTEDGLLRGQVALSAWNRTYLSFQAVPFAQPPVGELRFKSPKPVKPWTGVRDSREEGTYCVQDVQFPTTANISEDCLYLNVYVPQVASNASRTGGLPVMVWIYGGGFTGGGGVKSIYAPDNLLNRSSILVTFNYRVGALGFLSMEHPDVTSNAALKDQVAALRWVRRNIAHFGGDPDEVTIFGESAGGISVDMHLLSPMSEGLFKRAISQSGSALAVNFKPRYNATGEAFRLGAALGYNGTDADELVRFLRSVPAQDILKGQKLVGAEEGATATTLIAFPVIDAKTQEGSEVFLTDVPEKLFRAGKVHPVPYITGFNSEEAKGGFTDLTQADMDSYNKNLEQFIPKSLNMEKGTKESLELAAKIKNFYFGNKSISFDTLPQLVNLASDNFMIYPVHRSAMLHVNYGSSPLYMYMFTYYGTLNLDSGNYTIKGAAHADDLHYFFYQGSKLYSNATSDDMKVIQHFTGMWTDFNRFGDPSRHESVKWTPATKTSRTYLQIDADLSLHRDAYKERMAFWDQVFDTYKKDVKFSRDAHINTSICTTAHDSLRHVNMWAALVLLFCLTSSGSSLPLKGEDGTVTVRTEDGLLRGQVATSAWNRTYLSFQAVPFAQPPVGELRFKSPKPVKPWTGVRDSREEGTYCVQDVMVPTTANVSEDCLYLNVYVPQAASNASRTGGLPVMVWIYGGAFIGGAGIKSMYAPDNLMNRSSILVTLNYRVGALGFLSMEHPDVTSNAALKDQVAALRWVRRNIAHFGGDPDKVTIFGESAGGISVDMHLLSPMSEGLFRRAISQSGSALAVNFKPRYNATGEAFRLGAALGYNGTDADELVRFLRSVPAQDILKGQKLVGAEEGATATTLIAFPVVDAKTQEGSEVFLTDVPEKLFRAGKVHPIPYIIGFNSEESKADYNDLTQADMDSYNKNLEQFIPKSLNMKKGTKESLELAAKIKSFYFGNKSISFDTLPQLVNLESDNFMIYPVHRSAMLHVNYGSSPLYIYMFTYDGTLHLKPGNYTIKGPAHADDTLYLFYQGSQSYSNLTSGDMKVIQHFTGMWTDFALYGDPSRHESVKWTPATKTSRTYLQIDADLSLHRDAYKERMAFWDQVFDTYKK
ncbi:uncharacterized protein LOC134534613 [Bacillus rossius redtenbacheri]|uniref:uncharacterized protein LOC134534613 n=1 Tax=Bacillus rossius redtenbacheri TaxID=93214 RepID=UPI002FDCD022